MNNKDSATTLKNIGSGSVSISSVWYKETSFRIDKLYKNCYVKGIYFQCTGMDDFKNKYRPRSAGVQDKQIDGYLIVVNPNGA
jgi:hypothetical protein